MGGLLRIDSMRRVIHAPSTMGDIILALAAQCRNPLLGRHIEPALTRVPSSSHDSIRGEVHDLDHSASTVLLCVEKPPQPYAMYLGVPTMLRRRQLQYMQFYRCDVGHL
jgi:hypothetical protein